jgi:hypothetical protein
MNCGAGGGNPNLLYRQAFTAENPFQRRGEKVHDAKTSGKSCQKRRPSDELLHSFIEYVNTMEGGV